MHTIASTIRPPSPAVDPPKRLTTQYPTFSSRAPSESVPSQSQKVRPPRETVSQITVTVHEIRDTAKLTIIVWRR